MKDYKERVEKIRKDCEELKKVSKQKEETQKLKDIPIKKPEELKEWFLEYILSKIEAEVENGRVVSEIFIQDMGNFAEEIIRCIGVAECKKSNLIYSTCGFKKLSDLYDAISEGQYGCNETIEYHKMNYTVKKCSILNGFLTVEYLKTPEKPIGTPNFVFSAHFIKITPKL